MKKNTFSVYATNKGGKIESPKNPQKNDPRSAKKSGGDLRVKRG